MTRTSPKNRKIHDVSKIKIKTKNKTKKIHNISHVQLNKKKINGKVFFKQEGWITIEIHGSPFERGFAHGYLLHGEMKNNLDSFEYLIKQEFGVSLNGYIELCNKKIKPVMEKDFPEFYEELQGIAAGFCNRGLHLNVEYLIAWNAFLSMYSYFENTTPSRCSAFIATGDATEKGDIVMSHNTHSYFYISQMQNVILYINPEKGYPFVMQTVAGYIASGTDWFLCSTGIIGCETTISGIKYVPEFGSPYFCRIRQAMQYGKTLDEYTEIMLKNNAGDYACSWMFGDINTNEIMLFDIGLKTHSIKRTKNGVYHGMNSVIDNNMRKKETTDVDLFNLKDSSGSRNNRLNYLLNDFYYGKINVNNAKKIISDHYDEYLHKEIKNSRGICKHEEKNNEENYPFGCTDGKVVNTQMAKKLSFYGRFGSSCGRKFHVNDFVEKNPKYKKHKHLLMEILPYRWLQIHK